MITSEEIIAWMRDYAGRLVVPGATTEMKFIFLLSEWLKDEGNRKYFNEDDRNKNKQVVITLLEWLKNEVQKA